MLEIIGIGRLALAVDDEAPCLRERRAERASEARATLMSLMKQLILDCVATTGDATHEGGRSRPPTRPGLITWSARQFFTCVNPQPIR
jgi:hypothetical protein